MVLKQLFFLITKNRLAAGAYTSRLPLMMRLNYSTLLYSKNVSQFAHFPILTIGLSPPL